jgi:lipoprotein-anchoring transpeptidase ErfK/SrfK
MPWRAAFLTVSMFALASPALAVTPAQKAQVINDATVVKAGYSPALVKAQTLLDRAGFSPGVIDGYTGRNFRGALAAFAKAQGLKSSALDPAMWDALGAAEPAAEVTTLTAADVAGPYTASIPAKFSDQAKLTAMDYTSAREKLAERFHMDQTLLTRLNPGAKFAAGESIVVVKPGSGALPAQVATIRVDTKREAVTAYDANNTLIGYFPATVGSKDYPAPEGTWAVNAVAFNPVYYYDPKRLTFGEGQAAGAMKLAAGPNNPVGAVWIDLSKDTYGIHGAPDPKLVGKVNSHGCVRLTNWDALTLAKAVAKGTKVVFESVGT